MPTRNSVAAMIQRMTATNPHASRSRARSPMADTDANSIPVDSPSEADALRQRLEATEQQLDNFKRLAADYENARKRTARKVAAKR